MSFKIRNMQTEQIFGISLSSIESKHSDSLEI